MTDAARTLVTPDPEARTRQIVDTLTGTFADLMERSPAAFRSKFRKMAADPFAFYRGSACLFYVDIPEIEDPWADERTSRVWIQGDLHAENFGTYMDSSGVLVFDLNDFDEAYLGHFTWDLRRLAASIALLGWRKALPDPEIERLVAGLARTYLQTVRSFSGSDTERDHSLRRDNTSGAVLELLAATRESSREQLLDAMTEIEGSDRAFRENATTRRLDDDERREVLEAYEAYLDTIPEAKRLPRAAYTVLDVVAAGGFGIGSAGLPAYTLLIEGFNEALDNDVVLSMKQGQLAAPSTVPGSGELGDLFRDHGHRTALSQRALQAHSDRMLGHTRMRGVGYVVSELSPYVADLEWDDLTEPDEIAEVLSYLGRATARAHCVSDADADTGEQAALVDFQVEDAILAAVDGRDEEFVSDLVAFALDYGAVVCSDHRLFVEAFRHDRIPGVSATG